MSSEREILAKWNMLAVQVEDLAAKCQADPAVAVLEGVEPEIERADQKVYGRSNATALVNVRAGWLRGAAKKLIPAEFKWMVQEMIGGNAALMLLSYEPGDSDGEK